MYDSRVQKLSRTMHSLAVQKSLTDHKNERPKEALVNEKKRRQQGKLLLLKAS